MKNIELNKKFDLISTKLESYRVMIDSQGEYLRTFDVNIEQMKTKIIEIEDFTLSVALDKNKFLNLERTIDAFHEFNKKIKKEVDNLKILIDGLKTSIDNTCYELNNKVNSTKIENREEQKKTTEQINEILDKKTNSHLEQINNFIENSVDNALRNNTYLNRNFEYFSLQIDKLENILKEKSDTISEKNIVVKEKNVNYDCIKSLKKSLCIHSLISYKK